MTDTTENVFEAKARDLLLGAFTKNGAEERDGVVTFEFKISDLVSAIAAALEAERLEEREACAKIIDNHELASRENGFSDAADIEQMLAAAIRGRETDNG
jgi:hypothetical protein